MRLPSFIPSSPATLIQTFESGSDNATFSNHVNATALLYLSSRSYLKCIVFTFISEVHCVNFELELESIKVEVFQRNDKIWRQSLVFHVTSLIRGCKAGSLPELVLLSETLPPLSLCLSSSLRQKRVKSSFAQLVR